MKKLLLCLLLIYMIIPTYSTKTYPAKAYESTLQLYETDWSKNIGGTGNDYYQQVVNTTDGGYIAIGHSNVALSETWGNNGSSDAIIVKHNADGNIEWAKNVGGTGNDYFYSVVQTDNGEYIAVGSSSGTALDWGNNGSSDAIIVRFYSNGAIKWAKNIGSNVADIFRSITKFNDSYVAVGSSSGTALDWGNNGNSDGIIVQFDTNGVIEWAKNTGSTLNDYYYAIDSASDGCIVVGYSNAALSGTWGNNGGNDAIIVKYDIDGEVEWAKNIGSSSADYFNNVLSTDNNDFVAVGYSAGSVASVWGNNGSNDAIIVKYNTEGEMKWAKNAGGSGGDVYYSAIQTNDNYLVIAGYSAASSSMPVWENNGGNDAIIVKYSTNGDAVWTKNFGSSIAGGWDIYYSVCQTAKGGIMAAGTSNQTSTQPVWGNNVGYDAILVNCSDITPPTGKITYSTTEETTDPITVTLVANESIQEISGWLQTFSNTYTKIYTANSLENITIIDLAGNTATVKVSIENILKTKAPKYPVYKKVLLLIMIILSSLFSIILMIFIIIKRKNRKEQL